MKKSLVVTLLVLMGAAVPWAASAQDCQYQNVKLDFRSVTPIDPGIYDFCLGDIKATGTINGTYEVCFYDVDFVPSKSIFSDGVDNVFAEKYYSRIVTKKGIVDLVEWGWYDDYFGLEYGMSRMVGGTGDFEGMIGTFYWTPRFPALGGVNPLDGYICIPWE